MVTVEPSSIEISQRAMNVPVVLGVNVTGNETIPETGTATGRPLTA